MTPVIGVDGAWVRPGEVLVDVAFEREIADRLRELGGRPYVPSRDDEHGLRPGPVLDDNVEDWRRRPFAPDYGDVNARLDEAGLGFHLWVGFATRRAVRLVRKGGLPGVYFNPVYLGENVLSQGYYQGGPRGYAKKTAGPTTFPSVNSVRPVDVSVLDTGLPANWTSDYPPLQDMVTVVAPGIDPLDERPKDGVLDKQACHGLFICGLIARRHMELKVESHRVMYSSGETDDTIVCPVIALSTGAVVNLSFGGFSTNNQVSIMMANAVQAAVAGDKILVAAAGNTGTIVPASPDHSRPFWPAAHPDVIAVGALDSNSGTFWPWTNRADIYAPGVSVLSMHAKKRENPEDGQTYEGWAEWSGSSFAAPVVAAEIATVVANLSTGRHGTAKTWVKNQTASGWLGKPGQSGDGTRLDVFPPLTIW